MSARLIIPDQLLQDGAEKLGLVLLEEQLQALMEFASLLANFNEHTNLVANCEPEVLLRDHILDSLSLISPMKKCAKKMKMTGRAYRLIDIGTGGGFPGLILAIADAALKVALVESVAKKTRFLSEAVTALALSERVTVHNSRAESLAHDKEYGHQFDFATCRAVGSLSTVLELTLPFLKRSGIALIQRSGAQARQEAVPVAKAVGKLGGRLVETIHMDEVVLAKERAVLIFEQKALTGRPYPRPWPKPKDSPLF